jgi:hypothetical protein
MARSKSSDLVHATTQHTRRCVQLFPFASMECCSRWQLFCAESGVCILFVERDGCADFVRRLQVCVPTCRLCPPSSPPPPPPPPPSHHSLPRRVSRGTRGQALPYQSPAWNERAFCVHGVGEVVRSGGRWFFSSSVSAVTTGVVRRSNCNAVGSPRVR